MHERRERDAWSSRGLRDRLHGLAQEEGERCLVFNLEIVSMHERREERCLVFNRS